ncbi:S8 family serine peptidase [Nocardia abscessus]|uniref:S8 family serine peptidase n=1 Tax=Nocardia abscessus TaxID=120957 RepID=UPI003CC800A4
MAVIDTGVARHPRLPGLIAGGDYVSSGDGTEDCDAHGTLIAGLIAATEVDGQGFSGVAPEAQILTIRQTSRLYQKEGSEPRQGSRRIASGIRHHSHDGFGDPTRGGHGRHRHQRVSSRCRLRRRRPTIVRGMWP